MVKLNYRNMALLNKINKSNPTVTDSNFSFLMNRKIHYQIHVIHIYQTHNNQSINNHSWQLKTGCYVNVVLLPETCQARNQPSRSISNHGMPDFSSWVTFYEPTVKGSFRIRTLLVGCRFWPTPRSAFRYITTISSSRHLSSM